jgi:hypothetical protein
MFVTIVKIRKWEKAGNLSKLIQTLQSSDPELRKAVCLSIASLQSAQAMVALRYIETYDEDQFVKLTATQSIQVMLSNVPYFAAAQEEIPQEVGYLNLAGQIA